MTLFTKPSNVIVYVPMKKQDSQANLHRDDVRIRPLAPRDRSAIEDMVIASGKFNDVEVATALELVDEALRKGEESGYIFAVLETGNEKTRVRGYACYGPVPLTQGAYDLYWIVVEPA